MFDVNFLNSQFALMKFLFQLGVCIVFVFINSEILCRCSVPGCDWLGSTSDH